MKRLAMLIITLSVVDSTQTIISDPNSDTVEVVIFKKTCYEDEPRPCLMPALSTGPYVLKATSGDCYKVPYINPNGTLPATTWVTCP